MALFPALGGQAFGQANFFEDKTIKLVIGFSAGGISDLWGRALSRATGDRRFGQSAAVG